MFADFSIYFYFKAKKKLLLIKFKSNENKNPILYAVIEIVILQK